MDEIEALKADKAKLREALTRLLAYNPRKRWVGGVENGRYEEVGGAKLQVIDACRQALEETNDG